MTMFSNHSRGKSSKNIQAQVTEHGTASKGGQGEVLMAFSWAMGA